MGHVYFEILINEGKVTDKVMKKRSSCNHWKELKIEGMSFCNFFPNLAVN